MTASLSAGSAVDHFQIIRLLGEGGMGEVYLARDTLLGRKVALKFLRLDRLAQGGGPEDDEAPRRILREAQATAKLSHPHIVGVFHVGNFMTRPYVALEYVEGPTLRQRMRDERPGTREAIRIGLAVARALEEAHHHHVWHRDLKPENVLLARDGRLRVVDFGLAKVLDDPPQLLALGSGPWARAAENAQLTAEELFGTPAYMAPEQWLEEPSSGATDVWALGIMLAELLLGHHPGVELSLSDWQLMVVGPDPMPPLPVGPGVPQALADLVGRCLAKAPDERPPAGEVAEKLEELLVGGVAAATHSEESPFRGLLTFREHHAAWFFGRDTEIAAFVERMRDDAVLPVVGPSGAGKSSFIQAGVVPRLREQGAWRLVALRPTAQPFASLARALLRRETGSMGSRDTTIEPAEPDGPDENDENDEQDAPLATREAEQQARLATRLAEQPGHLGRVLRELAATTSSKVLLFVDQLEELSTMVDDAETRRAFMGALLAAADDPSEPVRLCFTLRDDFLGRFGETRAVREALSHVTILRSPGPEALHDILTKPLRAVGYDYDDPKLVDEMIAAISGEHAGLPLVQFTARLLWDRRDRHRRLLRRADYDAMGGVAGALADHADGVLASLGPEETQLTRALLLRLVTSEGTRRTLVRSAVVEGLEPKKAEEVLSRLIEARLLAVHRSRDEGAEPELDLAHESLIVNWHQLHRWIEESHEELAFIGAVDQAAELWNRLGRHADETWRGETLADAVRTVEQGGFQLSALSRTFLDASRSLEQRRRRRARLVFAAIATLLLCAGSFALYTMVHGRTMARIAQRFGQEAQAIEQTARIVYLLPLHDTRPDLAKIEQRMQAMAASMPTLGDEAAAAGHYALGRGYLALHRFGEAKDELEAARRMGVKNAELRYDLGVAYGELYRQGLVDLQTVTDTNEWQTKRAELEKRTRDPALVYLRPQPGEASRSLLSEATIAFLERNWEQAITKSEAAAAEQPLDYEAKFMAARVRYEQALDNMRHGHYQEAQKGMHDALVAIDAAREVGRSDPAVYNTRVDIWSTLVHIRWQVQKFDDSAFASAIEAVDQALQANPQNAGIRTVKARLYRIKGEYELMYGHDDPLPALDAAQKELDEIAKASDRSDLRVELGIIWMRRGQLLEEKGDDGRQAFVTGLGHIDAALKKGPDYRAHQVKAIIYDFQADAAERRGADPRPALQACVAETELALVNRTLTTGAQNFRCRCRTSLAHYAWMTGASPEADLAAARDKCGESITANPNYPFLIVSVAQMHIFAANLALATGQDPKADLADARLLVERMLQRIPDGKEGLRLRLELEIAAGRVDPACWVEAEALIDRLRREGGEDLPVLLLWAQLERWRADGRGPKAAADERFRSARDALAHTTPRQEGRADVWAARCALASLAGDAAEAQTACGRAFAVNPLLEREYGRYVTVR